MALLQYFRSVPREQLLFPGESLVLVLAKGLIFAELHLYAVARKFNLRIVTVIYNQNGLRENLAPRKHLLYDITQAL